MGWGLPRSVHLRGYPVSVYPLKSLSPKKKGSMYGIYTYIWFIFVVNVGKQTIHGSYDIWYMKIRDYSYCHVSLLVGVVGTIDFVNKKQLKYHHGFFNQHYPCGFNCRFAQQKSGSPRLNLPKTNNSHLKLGLLKRKLVFLDGGLEYFVFSPRSLGEMIQFELFKRVGENHQPSSSRHPFSGAFFIRLSHHLGVKKGDCLGSQKRQKGRIIHFLRCEKPLFLSRERRNQSPHH